MSVKSKMTAIADKIRALLGISGTMGLDAMATNLTTAQNEVSTQEDLITQIAASLEGKAAGGGNAVNTGICTVVVTPASNTNHYTYREVMESDGTIGYKMGRSYTSSNITMSARCDSTLVVMATYIKSATATGGEVLAVASGYGVAFKTPSTNGATAQIKLGS